MRGLVNVIVLFPKQEFARNIRNLLVRSGFEVIGVCVTGSQVIQRMEGLDDGLVVCGYKYTDMMYSELREYLPKDIHMLLLASQAYLEDCVSDNVSCLPMPLKAYDLVNEVRNIVSDISNIQKKKKRRPKQRTREELELLDEVKELLMENNRITEEEAHCYIQQRSMNSGVGLIEMAKMIKESFTYQN
ncbi:ANTAR domain-containing response regulator [Anaerostipes sp.]|uniref:ANTAR domain-containing response regulator n=1 Tax=Anaerostipes sp. TaxID=1872530 RepID=UPI002588AD75|nr:ANTAR domain-containing protein [Anaerostipes sp.]MCI5624266.1 ANTAR domain-containing protein [Anaerostipes sp.]MDY2726421.1 ANTAR domain-containing protein [Anaerostipes faecalis]